MKMVSISLVLLLALVSCLAEQCHYEGYTHLDHLYGLIEHYRNDVIDRTAASVQKAKLIITDFEVFVLQQKRNDRLDRCLALARNYTNQLVTIFLDSKEEFLGQYDIESSTGTDLVLGAGQSIATLLSEGVSKMHQTCDLKTQQITSQKLYQSYDSIKDCIHSPEQTVHAAIDNIFRIENEYLTQLSREFDAMKFAIESSPASILFSQLDYQTAHLHDLITGAAIDIPKAVSQGKVELAVAVEDFNQCSKSLVRRMQESVNQASETMEFMVDKLLENI